MTIFDEQITRKPDRYPWTEQFMNAMQDGFWTNREFNFNSDIQDFKVNLDDQEREIIIRSLATIASIETPVKNYWKKMGDNLPHPSINDMGIVMANIEVTHSQAYERLLEMLGITNIFEDILKLDIIKGRDTYLKKHLHKFHSDNKKQFIYSIILFTLFVENIALFSQFYTITWFGKFKNVLKDTNKQVEYTQKEEDLHAKIGIRIINQIRQEYPELFDDELENKILHEAEQAIKYECKIIEWIVNGYKSENLNSNLLEIFIKHRMNESLKEIGYSAIFEIDTIELEKCDWFYEQLLGNNMTDFFHGKPVEYSRSDKSFDEDDLFS